MDASRTEAFCTRSCPFSSLSSSFMSKSLQSWTRNVSRNASENAWKRSNRHGRKPPVHPREPRVAAVSGFPDTAGRVPTGNPKPDVAPPCGRTENSTKAQRIGFGRKRKCGKRGKHRNRQNRGILDAAARKQEKAKVSCAHLGEHICPQCGQFGALTQGLLRGQKQPHWGRKRR